MERDKKVQNFRRLISEWTVREEEEPVLVGRSSYGALALVIENLVGRSIEQPPGLMSTKGKEIERGDQGQRQE